MQKVREQRVWEEIERKETESEWEETKRENEKEERGGNRPISTSKVLFNEVNKRSKTLHFEMAYFILQF